MLKSEIIKEIIKPKKLITTNNNWINEDKVEAIQYRSFFRFGANKKLFADMKEVLEDVKDIYNKLNIIVENNNCFNYEYIKVMKMYIFIYMLKKITKVKKTKEVLNEVKDRKAFSFYSYIDTALSGNGDNDGNGEGSVSGDDEYNTEEISLERGVDYELSGSIDDSPTNNDFIEKIEKQQTKSRKIMVEFVIDIIEDLSEYQKVV